MTSLLRIAAAAALAVLVAVGPARAQVEIPAGAVAAVDFTEGQAVARNAAGQERPLAKGAGIARGDSVITGDGRVQLRFLDEGYLSIYANTEFLIEDYFYGGQADGSESAAFRLVQGGIRALTGAIGKANRDNYSVATTIGTIGIRGTGYTAQMGDGMSASVSEGAISLANRAGQLLIRPGQTGFMASADTPPTLVAQRPYLPPTPPATRRSEDETSSPPPQQFRPADQRTPEGGLEIIPHHDDHGYGGADYSFVGHSVTGQNAAFTVPYLDTREGTTVYLDGDNVNSWEAPGSDGLGRGGKGIADAANSDGVVTWSRWTEGYMTYRDGDGTWPYSSHDPALHSHVVVGAPATALPTSGSADYALVGGTSPTFTNGDVLTVGSLSSATLRVDFASQRVGLELTATAPGTIVTISTPGGLSNTSSAGMSLSAQGGSSVTQFFSGQTGGSSGQLIEVTQNSTACLSCNGKVQGFLAGAGASHAGLAFSVADYTVPSGSETVNGVAAFKR